MPHIRPAFLLAVVLVLTAARPGAELPQAPATAPIVVVDTVEAGSTASTAGVRAGDELIGWREHATGPSVGQSRGDFSDPWRYEIFTIETASRVAVVLQVRREGRTIDIVWPARTSRFGLTLRPGPGAATSADDRVVAWVRAVDADGLVARRQFDAAATTYQQLLAMPAVSADPVLAALVQGRIATLEFRRGRAVEALDALDAAVAATPQDLHPLLRAHWMQRRVPVLQARGRYDEAVQSGEAAVTTRGLLAPGSRDEAFALSEIGTVELARGRLDAAWDRYEAAKRLLTDSERRGFETAQLDYNLALVDQRRGRLADADRRVQGVLELTRAMAPLSVQHARALSLAGTLRSQSGQLPQGGRFYEEALAVLQRIDPGGPEEASVTNNLGIVAMQRGRFAEAERYYRRSLALKEQLGLPPMELVSSIGNLGLMSIERHDLASARAYLRQVLTLARQVAPEGPVAANALNNLAKVERLSGNVADAEQHARDGLAMRAKFAPDTVLHAFSLAELGRVLEAANRLDEADVAHRQALAIRQSLAPDGTNAADSLDALGRLAHRRGDLGAAARLHEQAGAIWEHMAPDGVYAAVNLVERARVATSRTRNDEALSLYARATDILDTQTGSIGGSFETQADFRRTLVTYYHEFAELLIARGRVADAFHVTERARARASLAMIAERDLATGVDVPDADDEKMRALGREYDRAQAELGTLSPIRDAARVEGLVRRLRDVKLELAAVRAEAGRALAGPASGDPATAVDAAEAGTLLDDGTVAISYLVGPRGAHAFVLSGARLERFTIPLDGVALAERVGRFNRLIARRDDATGEMAALARELYDRLIGPADAQLQMARRVMIVPDGPLHALPFAALLRAREPSQLPGRGQYFIEWRPVYEVPSLTTYGRLRALARSKGPAVSMFAAGDPIYGGAADVFGGTLSPLPGTRREIELIRGVYGESTQVLLDSTATETAVRAGLPRSDVIHLAVHGLTNEAFPLDSALAFATPAAGSTDNGLLQGWEIIEQVRLQASLVVLSACETAGSGDGGGEGLLGLARAFQLAGTPSVVASLWRVADDSTPTLMHAFHREVRRGTGLAEALASAQRRLLADPATAHPYHWAAFVLNGDAR